jgi:hypothetical protein
MRDGRFSGFMGWEDEPTLISEAILRQGGAELAIEFIYEGYRFITTLHRTPSGQYEGNFLRQRVGESYTDKASCRILKFDDDWFLFGRWTEDKSNYYWWGVLTRESDLAENPVSRGSLTTQLK